MPGGFFDIGLGMCGAVMMMYADEAARSASCPAMARGEEIWCQLFSEPAAGSDLAGLRTRAVRDGDEWVVNGQKIWTSGAHYSDYGILVTRHDPTLAKHKGLTFFFVDMKSPGHRDAADQADLRRLRLQRGLLHQRAHPRLAASRRGRRGLAGLDHDADERALRGRHASGPPDFKEIFALTRQLSLGDQPAIKSAAVRSFMSVVIETCQPSPTSPRRCESGMRHVGEEDLVEVEAPEICRIGFTSTPGLFMSSQKKVRPLCLAMVGRGG